MLEYEEFLDIARADENRRTWYLERAEEDIPQYDDEYDAFVISWVSGGMEGGSCWNNGATDRIAPDPVPEFEHLFTIFESVKLTFSEGMKILDLARDGHTSDSSYYGNYVDYSFRYIPFDEVYDKLVEFGKALPRENVQTP